MYLNGKTFLPVDYCVSCHYKKLAQQVLVQKTNVINFGVSILPHFLPFFSQIL